MRQSINSGGNSARRRASLRAAAVVAACAAVSANALPVHADTKTFSETATDWLDGANWTPNGVPGATDDVVVDLGTATMTLNDGAMTIQRITYSNPSSRILANTDLDTNFSTTLQLDGDGGTNPLIAVTNTGNFTIQGALAGTYGAFRLALNASGELEVSNAASSLEISAIISETGGARSITKTGAGTLALKGVNTFTGVTNIGDTNGIDAGGILYADADSRFGAVPGSATPGKINLYNGTLRLADGTSATTVITSGGPAGSVLGVRININRGVTLNAGNGKIEVPTGQYAEIPGIIASSGALHKIGGGILDLRTSGPNDVATGNTFTGGVIIDGGTLGIVKDLNLGAVPGATDFDAVQINNGATLEWYGTGGAAGLDAKRGVTIGAGGGVFDYGLSSGVPLVNFPITSSAGNTLTKKGPNTLQNNIVQPAMDGDLDINQGRFNVQVDGAAGDGTIYMTAANTGTANTSIAQLGIGTAGAVTTTITQPIVLAPTGGTNSFEITSAAHLILNGDISGTGGLIKGRVALTTGILTLGGNNSYTGGTTVMLGTVQAASNANLGDAAGGITLGGGASAPTLKATGNISGAARALALSSNGNIDTNGFDITLGNASGAATLTKTATTGTLTVNHVRTSGLTVNGGKVAIATNGGNDGASRLSALTLAAGTTLDLSDNDLIVDGGDYTTIETAIIQGYNSGNWLGTGITSSTAAANASLFALGIADNDDLNNTEFAGQTGLDGDEILVKHTYVGDANLTGGVNLDDFNQFLFGFNPANAAPQIWLNGDFNYTGAVNLDDFNLFLFGLANQGGPLVSPELFAALSEFANAAGIDVDLSAVPEPTGLGMLGIGAASLLRRRTRRLR